MDLMSWTDSPNLLATGILLVSYEVLKGLVAKGMRTHDAVNEALWKKGVLDSLTTLTKLTAETNRALMNHNETKHQLGKGKIR